MTASFEVKSEEGKVKTGNRRWLHLFTFAFCLLAAGSAGCRQRMADQPYYRPLEETDFFADGRASRPIEHGTVHRGQYLESDPMVTGLTQDEWKRAYEYSVPIAKLDATPVPEKERATRAFGAPRYDQSYRGPNYEFAEDDAKKPIFVILDQNNRAKRVPLDKDDKPVDKNAKQVRVKKAALVVPEIYVEEYPFQITQTDLKRGQERFTIYCAVCHGPYGNGQGKIWERGYLTPTSFHTAPVSADEVPIKNSVEGLGLSRGYKLWGHKVPMPEAPVGYYFEVITKGYGGMPSYSAQIVPADRWRIAAYIRALQRSQPSEVPYIVLDRVEIQKLIAEAGGKK